MEKEFWKDYFETLGDALTRLEEVLNRPDLANDDCLPDAVIQRFEFSIELYWKVLKKFLVYEKIDATTPRDVLKKAYQYGLIDDEKEWLLMMDDRNKTSHVYKQEEAIRVFENVKEYFPIMKKNYEKLKTKFYD